VRKLGRGEIARQSALSTQSQEAWDVGAHDLESRLAPGMDNELIAPTATANGTGQIRSRERLGGLLKFYHREAA
jgi:hypothetical protein